MKLLTPFFIVAALLNVFVVSNVYALDLYVDTVTKQIYAEPGPNRVHMGFYVRADEAPGKREEPAVHMTSQQTSEAKTNTEEIKAIRKELELKSVKMEALEEKLKTAEKGKMKPVPGLHYESSDGNFTASIDGRIQIDSQSNVINEVLPATGTDLPYELNNGANIRRARLGVEGTFLKNWDYKFEYDFSRGAGTVAAGITDAFLRYNFDSPLSIKVGSFKEPFSLEEATSNRFYTFIERHMSVNTFVDNPNTYKTGIGLNYAVPRWQFGIAFQTEPVGGFGQSVSSVNANGNQSRNNGSGDIGWQGIGRITGRPWMIDETKYLHVGISAGHTTVNNQYRADGSFSQVNSTPGQNSGGMSFVAFLGTNVDRTSVLNTGNLTSGPTGAEGSRRIDSYDRFGAESALVYGPFSAQAEFLRTNINGVGYSGEHLTGYYGYLSYFLTGESRVYHVRNGAWNRITPNSNFHWKGPGWGAWEFAVGYDYLNMNNGAIRGGEADMIRFALNWYPHSHVRVMSNLVHVLNINTANVVNFNAAGDAVANHRSQGFDDANITAFLTRVQVDF
ncbi:MAG: porin [Nitrosomonas sp.]|nr:porin [Nitrosomonas sp.]